MSRKITRALALALEAAGDSPVRCAIDIAVDRDRLPLSSFAARATARDSAILAGISAVMGAVRAWEVAREAMVDVTIRASEGIVEVAAPRDLIESLAELPETSALDVTGALNVSKGAARAKAAARTR